MKSATRSRLGKTSQGTLRSQLEAYLLTALTTEEIGTRLHLSARVVEIYTSCFFDVRGEIPDSARMEVVEAFKAVSPDRLYQDYFLKTVALVGNVEMLEAIMSPAAIQSVDEATAASAAEAKFILQHQVIEAAKTIDVSDPNLSRELRRLAEDMQEVQPKDEHTYLLEEIDKLCQCLVFAVGPPRPESATPDAVEFSKTPVELGLEDTLRVGLGLEPRNKELLRTVRFPDSPNDHEALKLPGTFDGAAQAGEENADNGDGGGEDAGAEEDDIPVDTAPPPTNEVLEPEPVERPNLSNMAETFKRERIQREQEAIQQKQADREKAAQEADAKAKAAQEALKAAQARAKEAEMERLDREWDALAGNATGQIRNRKWLEFRKMHGGYIPKEAREQLAGFKGGK